MKVDFLPYAYFEGDFVPFEDAKISIATHAVQYGTGAFGGIRGYLDESGESINIFRLLDHTKRLMDSARLLRAELNVDRESLARIIEDLTLKNNPQSDIYTRPFIYKAAQELSPRLKDMDSDIAVYQLPLGDYFDMSRPIPGSVECKRSSKIFHKREEIARPSGLLPSNRDQRRSSNVN